MKAVGAFFLGDWEYETPYETRHIYSGLKFGSTPGSGAKIGEPRRLAKFIDVLALSHGLGTEDGRLLSDVYYSDDAETSAALLPVQLSPVVRTPVPVDGELRSENNQTERFTFA